MFISNNCPSFHLWWKENFVKHKKVSRYYENNGGSRRDVEDKHVNFTLSASTSSIDNSKVKVAVLQQRQDWGVAKIKHLKLVIPEHYTFTGAIFFIALGILNNYYANATRKKSTLRLSS